MREALYKYYDKYRYTRILNMQDEKEKHFFNTDGCGLEIEFGVLYEYRSRRYIETGLRKLKEFVGDRGKFVPDRTIGSFLNVEIVLHPFPREELQRIFYGIDAILSFYKSNFVFHESCGVHANFLADEPLKKAFYNILVDGRYSDQVLNHSKYKADFMELVRTSSGGIRTYEEYVQYQHMVGGKYCGVNFLKDNLLEIRTLNLVWDNVAFFYDVYEEAKRQLQP